MTLSLEALDALQEHNWPGNIRELFRVLEAAAVRLPEGQTEISGTLISKHINSMPVTSGLFADIQHAFKRASLPELRTALADAERAAILTTLGRANFQVSNTARMLELARSTVGRKLRDWAAQGLIPPAILENLDESIRDN